jgi:hypothetical protein
VYEFLLAWAVIAMPKRLIGVVAGEKRFELKDLASAMR